MIRFLALFLLVACTSLKVYAQQPLLVAEEFNVANPNWYWSDINDDNNFRTVRNGILFHEQKNGANVYWTIRSGTIINPTKDFKIEVKFRAAEPMTQGMYYLVLNGADNYAAYFGINTEKKTYWIGSGQNGEWKTYNVTTTEKPEPTNDAIKTQLEWNTLSAIVSKGEISFYVNDVFVEKKNFNEVFPIIAKAIPYLGIASSGAMKTETDYFRIYQENAINLLTNDRFNIRKVRLPDDINSYAVEKWPVIAPDGKTLYFVREGYEHNPGGKESDDIWVSTAVNDTTWSAARPFPSPINNHVPNAVLSVTPDNNTLFLMHRYKPDGTNNGAGFSMSTWQNNGWSMPADVPMTNYYNEASTNEFFLSTDKKIMILCVQRKDTYGVKDLYVSMLQPDGTYGEPVNMGNVVNSHGGEVSPFLAADMRTLYFGSDGHPGYGSADIFVSKRLDESWTKWSTPLNLGPEINSEQWEAYFTIPASGAYAYVVSNAVGSPDLYRLKLPGVFRPEPVVIISGRVINTQTKKPIGAAVTYSDILSSELPGQAMASADGKYKIALPAGKNYSFLAEKEGFYAISENIDLTTLKGYEEISRDLYLTPLEAGLSIRLNNIFFDFNKADLKKESFQELDRVIRLLQSHSKLVIEVSGHTDNVGDDAYNQKLSQQRADAVKQYLLKKGVDAARLSSKGYGETKPITGNATDKDRSTNRRVEFIIIKV